MDQISAKVTKYIAGTATGMEKNSINTSWASGFGVNLLDTLVAKFYE